MAHQGAAVVKTSVIESTLQSFTRALSKALISEHAATQAGLLQKLDPRVRLVGVLTLVVAVVLSRRLVVMAALLLLAALIAVASRISVPALAKRVWLIIFGFTGLIAAPALFATPGDPVFRLPLFSISITAQGLRAAAALILRVETAATLTTVLVLSTPLTQVLRALRSLRLPEEVVTMLAMTHRYVFLLIETAGHMFVSRQSRTVGVLSGAEQRRMAARTAGVLLSKSIELTHEVYVSMLSRGFSGEVRLLSDSRMQPRDYWGLAVFFLIGGMAVWIGR